MPSLAPTLYNPGSRGQDARYDITGLQQVAPGIYSDGTYQYDSNGLDLSGRPPDYQGRAPADEMNAEGTGGAGLGSFGPGFDQMMQDLKAQGVADKASRDAAIKRSFINFGLGGIDLAKAAQTTGIGDLASVLDPQTLALASGNQFSVQKRLEQALADRKIADRVALRQRGAVRSGEAGYAAQNTQRAYDTDEYDASQKLLDYITGAQQGFVEAERARQMQLWQLALAAAQRGGYGGYGGYGGGGPSAPEAPAAPSAFTAPGYQNAQYNVGQTQPSGYQIPVGGGFYTTPQGDMTAKWNRLAGL